MFCNSRCFCLSVPSYPSLAQFSFLIFLVIFINFVPSFSLSSPAFVLICYKAFSFSFFAFVFYCSPSHPFLPYFFLYVIFIFKFSFSFYNHICYSLRSTTFSLRFQPFPRYAILLCPTKDIVLGSPPSGL